MRRLFWSIRNIHRHRWIGMGFSYASWVECEVCGKRWDT